MDEQRGLSKRLQRAGHILILLCVILAGSVFFTKDVNAASFSNTQREYIKADDGRNGDTEYGCLRFGQSGFFRKGMPPGGSD